MPRRRRKFPASAHLPRFPEPEDIPRVVIYPNQLFYHGTLRRRRYAPPCSYFSRTRAQASGVIYGPHEEPALARYVLAARVKEPTVFLDITGDEDRSFIGDFRYIQIMMSKLDLTQEEIDERGTGEADYARAFCNHREVFPDCAGLFRARYGLVVAEPDEVMDYIRLTRPARKGSWWPGGPRTRTDGLR